MRAVPYTCNYVSEPQGGYKGPVGVKFLPKDLTMNLSVAVCDHTPTRPTRHRRPVRSKVE